ncbi:MAG: helix-turn-helix domain-containing protein [Clostridiales bacterium]|nr:helix-turn-helix domain-containing protein [Clostridiales bacterium]
MNTQKEQILDYMRRNGSITSLEAVACLGIIDMRKRISEIIAEDGIKITKTPETGKNRYGKSCRYIRYSLQGKDSGQAARDNTQ